jgi:glycosyltransferase involved in cell wall biosynthesis
MQAAAYRKLFPKSRLIVWNGFSEHTEKGLPAWRTLQRRIFYRAADAASANGESAINYLLGLGVARQKIFRLPYCPDIAPLLKLPLAREGEVARRLLYVGKLIERKGLVPFLRILSNWLGLHPEEKRELWIAGDGPLRSELEGFPVPPQLRLTFLGGVGYDNLPELYAQGGLFVFPTLADEWGMVVNEALAAGLPVLGSAYSQAVEELVREGVTGWTFRPDRPNEVQQALNRALLTPTSALAELRGICRQTVGHLRPSDGAERLLRAIDFVVSGTSRG